MDLGKLRVEACRCNIFESDDQTVVNTTVADVVCESCRARRKWADLKKVMNLSDESLAILLKHQGDK
jgi:hypothetical protein